MYITGLKLLISFITVSLTGFKLYATGVGTGGTVGFATTTHDGIIKSWNIDGEEIPVVDVSGMSTTGYREKKFGSLKEPPEVTVELVYDDDDILPEPGVVDTATITWPGGGTLVGSGAFISRSNSSENEGDIAGTYRFKFDGVTGPTYSAGSS